MGTKPLKIAVLSGKGGTGKTFVSVNLAYVNSNAIYVDCDIEEPNGDLYFKSKLLKENSVDVKLPKIDHSKCSGCRQCIEFCKFNALAFINNKVKVFEDICHSCGGCTIICQEFAITEFDKRIGTITKGISDDTPVLSGVLNIGSKSGVPIIKQQLEEISNHSNLTIIDCPPGSSCTVMESIVDADYCLLVVEPTIFGIHNFNMVYNLVKLFNKPFGAIVNKSIDDNSLVENFCNENSIKILESIPFDFDVNQMNSEGMIISKELIKYKKIFEDISGKIFAEVNHESNTCS